MYYFNYMEELKERFVRMISGKEYIKEDDYRIGGTQWTSGLFNCQAILLVGKDIALGHFTEYKKSNIKKLYEMIKRMDEDPFNLGFIVVSGYKYEHDLWIPELEGRGISKIAEFSDEYEKLQRYTKFLAANKDEAILHIRAIDGSGKEEFRKLL